MTGVARGQKPGVHGENICQVGCVECLNWVMTLGMREKLPEFDCGGRDREKGADYMHARLPCPISQSLLTHVR